MAVSWITVRLCLCHCGYQLLLKGITASCGTALGVFMALSLITACLGFSWKDCKHMWQRGTSIIRWVMDTIVPVPWTSLPSQIARFLTSDVVSKLRLTHRRCLWSLALGPYIVSCAVNIVNSLGEDSPWISLLTEFIGHNDSIVRIIIFHDLF